VETTHSDESDDSMPSDDEAGFDAFDPPITFMSSQQDASELYFGV
jgi:hypothetical protein